MNISCSKRCKIRILSFLVALIAVLIGFWMQDRQTLKLANRQINHHYQAALDELSAGIDTISITLEKCKYASTPAGFCSLASQLALETGTVETALSALPLKGENTSYLAKFVSQVGDYSLYLSKKTALGEGLTGSERQNLYSLQKTAEELSTKLESARTVYNNFDSWERIIEDYFNGTQSPSELEDSFTDMETALSDTPTLVYDGPFSDHLSKRKSELIKNAEPLTEAKAKARAAEILSLDKNSLTLSGSEEGDTKAYIFDFSGGSIAITQRGGYPLYFRKTREVAEARLDYQAAVKAAGDYLNALNLGEFKESYYIADEGICTVNFTLIENGVTCYTDLIKVGVALDNGEILLMEARGFVANHREREKEALTPNKTIAEAKEVLNKELEIKAGDITLIPSGGLSELLCYEFYCLADDGKELLVYINAINLKEEKILVLLKTDGGTLTK